MGMLKKIASSVRLIGPTDRGAGREWWRSRQTGVNIGAICARLDRDEIQNTYVCYVYCNELRVPFFLFDDNQLNKLSSFAEKNNP